jgi:hypothetical protein
MDANLIETAEHGLLDGKASRLVAVIGRLITRFTRFYPGLIPDTAEVPELGASASASRRRPRNFPDPTPATSIAAERDLHRLAGPPPRLVRLDHCDARHVTPPRARWLNCWTYRFRPSWNRVATARSRAREARAPRALHPSRFEAAILELEQPRRR